MMSFGLGLMMISTTSGRLLPATRDLCITGTLTEDLGQALVIAHSVVRSEYRKLPSRFLDGESEHQVPIGEALHPGPSPRSGRLANAGGR